jgi:hypothetical protein
VVKKEDKQEDTIAQLDKDIVNLFEQVSLHEIMKALEQLSKK